MNTRDFLRKLVEYCPELIIRDTLLDWCADSSDLNWDEEVVLHYVTKKGRVQVLDFTWSYEEEGAALYDSRCENMVNLSWINDVFHPTEEELFLAGDVGILLKRELDILKNERVMVH